MCTALVAPSCSFLLLTDGLILMPFLSISFVGRLGESDMAALLRKVKAVHNVSPFLPILLEKFNVPYWTSLNSYPLVNLVLKIKQTLHI